MRPRVWISAVAALSLLVGEARPAAGKDKLRIPIGTILLPNQEVYESILRYAAKNFDSSLFDARLVTMKLSNADFVQINMKVCQMLREGVVAFVLAPDGAASVREMLTSYSEHFHIPLATALDPAGGSGGGGLGSLGGGVRSGTASRSRFAISTYVSTADATAALLRRYRWSQAAYIFDDTASPDILEAIQNAGVKVSVAKKVNSEAEASDAVLELSSLGRLKPEKIAKIVLNVNRPSLAKTVLSGMIREVKSFKNLNTQFIFTNPVSDDFWQYIRFRDAGSSLNVTAFRLVDSELPHVIRFHKQMMQLSSHRSLFHSQGTQTYLFLDSVNALLHGLENALREQPSLLDANLRRPPAGSVYYNGSRGLDCMDQSRRFESGGAIAAAVRRVKLPMGQSGPVEFGEGGERLQPTVAVIQGSHVGHVVRLGTYSAARGLALADRPEALPQIRLPGAAVTPAKELSVASVLNSPYLMQRHPDGEFSGFVPDLLEALANVVPFAYKIQAMRHQNYGRRMDNGSWSGLMAEVISKRVEIAVSDMALTAERQEAVEFTQPFFVDDLAVVMTRSTPAGRPSLSFFFVRVFSWQLWACVLAILAVFVIFSYILNHLAQSRLRNASSEKVRLSVLVWITAASLFGRSQGPRINSSSHRLLLVSWWLFLAVMTITYLSACIALLQTVLFGSGPDVFSRSKFAHDIANGMVDVGYVRHGTIEKMIKQHQMDIPTSHYMQLINSSRTRSVSSVAEGIRNVGPGFVFLGLKSQVDSYIGRDCNVKSYTIIPQFAQYSLVMPKMSPYRDMFNQGIEKIRESGVLADIKEKWIDSLVQCSRELEVLEVPAPIKYTALCGMFIVVLAGFILSLLGGVIEFCWARKRDSTKNEKPIQKVMWDKTHDSLKQFSQKDSSLGNDEEMTLNSSQANGTPKQVRVMV